MESLNVGIKRKISRRNDPNAEIAEEEFKKVKNRVFTRSKSRCGYCHAPTRTTATARQGHFEIHHKDDDHANQNDDNLILLCPFCHMVFSCGKHGKDFESPRDDSAYLLWLPQVPQNTLNLLAHILFQLRFMSENKNKFVMKEHPSKWLPDNIVETVNRLEKEIITVGTNNIANIFGKKKDGSTVEAYHFYEMLKNLSEEEYQKRRSVFHGIRLWPKQDKFSDLIQFLSINTSLIKSIPMRIFEN